MVTLGGTCFPTTCIATSAKKARKRFARRSSRSFANTRPQAWLMQVLMLDVMLRRDVRMGRSGALAARLGKMMKHLVGFALVPRIGRRPLHTRTNP